MKDKQKHDWDENMKKISQYVLDLKEIDTSFESSINRAELKKKENGNEKTVNEITYCCS
jgi:hypothetical protein